MIDTSRLYNWLGQQAEACMREMDDNELCTSLDQSVGPMYHGEALIMVRERMRKYDSTLRASDIDEYFS